jgi:hypothetical protein
MNDNTFTSIDQAFRSLKAKKQQRSASGTFVKQTEDSNLESVTPPPAPQIPSKLFSFSTKPPTSNDTKDAVVGGGFYVKDLSKSWRDWFKRLLNTDAITFKAVKIKTYVLIAMLLTSGGLAFTFLNYIRSTVPGGQYIPTFAKEAAFSGRLELVNQKYFLITGSDTVIQIEPGTLNANQFVGKRVLVDGNYDSAKKVVSAYAIKDLEIGTNP